MSTLGAPIGRARIAGATIEAPPDPPALIMPAMSLWRLIQVSNASAMAATDAPRSRLNTAEPPRPWLSAISCAVTSQVAGLPLVDTSTSRVRKPLATMRSRMKRSSTPFVSSVPATMTTGGPGGSATALGIGVASIRLGLAEAMRAADLDARVRDGLRPACGGRRIRDIDPDQRA